ncbi:MAG: inositol monophosphatase [Deltaproteobacteria bacterium]|jgi:myo-inositol-1(or 4)-monophosphatase|nr:inositol monophosphatase [Deltaproteobacteria bacterium]
MKVDLAEVLAVAKRAARRGAEEIARGYRERDLQVNHKGSIDLVTQYDLNSELAIRAEIHQAFPDQAILAEERGLDSAVTDGCRWHVDPLDGTTNFVHQHPFFAASVAFSRLDAGGVWEPLVGVIDAPILRERFWAVKGGGAFRQDLGEGLESPAIPLKVSPSSKMIEALFNTGFPYDVHSRVREIVAPFERVLGQAQAVRRAGAASLDLAFVAAGRSEGYWEAGLKPWDVAAGIILVTEAGGRVSDGQGLPYALEVSPTIVASNGLLHEELTRLLN